MCKVSLVYRNAPQGWRVAARTTEDCLYLTLLLITLLLSEVDHLCKDKLYVLKTVIGGV